MMIRKKIKLLKKRLIFITLIILLALSDLLAQTDITSFVKDTLKSNIYLGSKLVLGQINNNELVLKIDETVLLNAIIEEIGGNSKAKIKNLYIQKEIEGNFFLYCDGYIGKKRLAVRISLNFENQNELFLTPDSKMEYCVSDAKCDKIVFVEHNCICDENPKLKKINYYKIDKYQDNKKGIINLIKERVENE